MVHRPTRALRRALGALGLAAVLVSGCSADTDTDGPEPGPSAERELSFDGPADGTLLNAEDLASLRFVVTASIDDAELTVDVADIALQANGLDVTDQADHGAAELSWEPGTLDDGAWTVRVLKVPVAEPDEDAGEDATDAEPGDAEPADPEELFVWSFEVDATPPELVLTGPEGPLVAGRSVTFVGTTEPGATVEVAGASGVADDDGAFEVELEDAPNGPVTLVATDPAGNVTTDEAAFVVVPSRVELEQYRAIHVSMCGWGSPVIRDTMDTLLEAGIVNAVQLDLKNEAGELFNVIDHELAEATGSGEHACRYDLEAAIEELHGRGVPVIGRIVAFADPILAPWAWDNDRRDLAIQLPDGSDIFRGSYAGFSNFTHPDVIDYNISVAETAARLGVDHILWDYIRRPEGFASYVVPGLETTPEEAVADFARQADERIARYGVQHGASVYGIAADRPTQIGQDIRLMGDHLDYVAPMIYPSHWGSGEYGIADPNREPYAIITATLEVWAEVTADRRARVVPWIEDTAYRAWDRPFQVSEQLRALEDAGIEEWLMWDSRNSYSGLRTRLPG